MHNQQQNMQNSQQMPPQQNEGAHALLEAHEAVESLIGSLEHLLLYETHIQDQALQTIAQRQRSFLSQLYNTIVDTLKSGQDPNVPTQTYEMEQSNDVVYGMQPAAPKSPSQSVNDIDDACVSSFMLDNLKAISSDFTLTALEATQPVLRRVIADSIPNIIEMAYELFLYQNKNQYYQVPQLQAQDMQQMINGFAPTQNNMTH